MADKGFMYQSAVDNKEFYVPSSITTYNEDGTFTQELKDFVAAERETGKGIGSTTVTPSRFVQPPDSVMGYTPPSAASIDAALGRVEAESNVPVDPNRPSTREAIVRSVAGSGVVMGETLIDIKEGSKFVINQATNNRSGVDLLDYVSPTERASDRARATEKTARFAAAMTGVDLESIYDSETGEMKSSETMVGYATDIALFFNAYGHLSKLKSIKNIQNPIAREVAIVGVMENFLVDPEEGNIATALEEGFIDPESNKPHSWAAKAVEFLSIDSDDPKHMKRLKMQVDTIGLGVLFEVVGNQFVRRLGREKFDAKAEDLTNDQRVEILTDGLEEARLLSKAARQGNIDPETGELVLSLNISDTDAGVRQVINQSRGFTRTEGSVLEKTQDFFVGNINRLGGLFFSQRGYLTNSGKSLLDDSVYAQRATMQKATDIAGRLTTKINDITSNSSIDSELPSFIQNALTSDFSMPRVINAENYNDTIENLIVQFSIPREIAPEVLEARMMVDDLSRRMLHSDSIDPAVKEIINENIGGYLRRSYNAYETPGWTPGVDVRLEAEDFLREQLLKSEPNLNMDALNTRVSDSINELLDTNIFEYTDKSRTLNKFIFKGKQEIPPEIRALLGEIEDPADNLMQTVAKMSKFYEVSRFQSNLNELANGQYIFDDGVARDTNIFTTQLKLSENSPLNGKWTTPEVAATLQNNNAWNPMGIIDNTIFRNFATAKGTSQMTKTVLSVATQARNIAGGVQFGLANGVWPFTGGVQSNAALWNNMLRGGDEALEESYRSYQRLGIINTSVRLNEFRSLLEIGSESTADNFLGKLKSIPYAGNAVGNTIDGATNVYMATDDFFKINNYQKELDTLVEAYPNEALDVLEQEAARKVKNTFPNYDRVPSGVKTLRFLPMGNFVSFPAEVWRTSYNIVTEASREIVSGNPVLKQRGLQRLSGYMLSMGSWQGAATGTAIAYGLSPEEEAAINTVTETDYNRGGSRNIVRAGNKFYTQDTTNYNSYNTIRAPLMAVYEDIKEGKLQGNDLDAVLLQAGMNFSKTLIEPFIAPAMITQGISDAVFASQNNGVTPDGSRLWREGELMTDVIPSIVNTLVTPFIPGTIDSAVDLYNIAQGNVNEYSGKLPPMQAELVASLMGIRFQEVDPIESLGFALRDYEESKSNWVNPSYPNFRESADDIIKQVDTSLGLQYQALQDLYSVYTAVNTLLNEDEEYGQAYWERYDAEEDELSPRELRAVSAYSVLKDAGATKDVLDSMSTSSFLGRRNVFDLIKQSFERGTPFADEILEEEAAQKLDTLFETSIRYIQAPLNFAPTERFGGYGGKEEWEKKQKALREGRQEQTEARSLRGGFAKGGEVYNVPQVPTEPDERIDKMTGLPYDEQAGTAFTDEEDRKLFNRGGLSSDVLANIINTASSSVPQEQKDQDIQELRNMASDMKNFKRTEQESKPLLKTPEEKFGSIYNSLYGAS